MTSLLIPGQQVRVVRTVRAREGPWRTSVEGRVTSYSAQPTGSWFAHGKADRFWLQRLRIEKGDGEIVDLILDGDSTVTILEPPATAR